LKSLLVVAAIAAFAAQANPLSAVLERAAEYVARYEEKELGNLLVAETYLQTRGYLQLPGSWRHAYGSQKHAV
jgi:hypothetical protein